MVEKTFGESALESLQKGKFRKGNKHNFCGNCPHILFSSPFDVFFCNVAPAFSADRAKFALIVDVDLDVCTPAFSVPWVATVFNWTI